MKADIEREDKETKVNRKYLMMIILLMSIFIAWNIYIDLDVIKKIITPRETVSIKMILNSKVMGDSIYVRDEKTNEHKYCNREGPFDDIVAKYRLYVIYDQFKITGYEYLCFTNYNEARNLYKFIQDQHAGI